MNHVYLVMMNDTGESGKYRARVEMTITAASETAATTEAKRRHPNMLVCYIEQKK